MNELWAQIALTNITCFYALVWLSNTIFDHVDLAGTVGEAPILVWTWVTYVSIPAVALYLIWS